MKKHEANELDNGLYVLRWKDGSSSLAAVGRTSNGDAWMAPTNWLNVGLSEPKHWHKVASVEPLVVLNMHDRNQSIRPSSDLVSRAFEIADKSMFELLQSECVSGGMQYRTLNLTDKHGEVFTTLAESSKGIKAAVSWLVDRGYVELRHGALGDSVFIFREPSH